MVVVGLSDASVLLREGGTDEEEATQTTDDDAATVSSTPRRVTDDSGGDHAAVAVSRSPERNNGRATIRLHRLERIILGGGVNHREGRREGATRQLIESTRISTAIFGKIVALRRSRAPDSSNFLSLTTRPAAERK